MATARRTSSSFRSRAATTSRARTTAARAPARAATARPSTSRALSTRTTTTTEKRSIGPYILGAGALAVLGIFLWSRVAKANPIGPIVPPPIVPPPITPPRPNVFPPDTPGLNRIAVTTGEGGMNLRNGPAPTGPIVGSAPNGSIVQVVRDDVAESGRADTPGRYRWAEIRTTPGGRTYYLRSVGPNGERNIQAATPAQASGGIAAGGPAQGALSGLLLGYMPAQPYPAIAYDPYAMPPMVPMAMTGQACGCAAPAFGAVPGTGCALPGYPTAWGY